VSENKKKTKPDKTILRSDYNSVLEAFHFIANDFASSVAVRAGVNTLTYRELDQRSSALARLLKEKGIKKNDQVGITSERRIEMAVALLGILKAGGAYVPLEESYPNSRLQFIARDTRLKLVLGQSSAMWDSSIETLAFNEFPVEKTTPSKVKRNGESIAYIMYTSGSTGDPKGVSVPDRAILRLVKNQNFIDLHSNNKILQNSPIAFDASTLEIWGALLNGCELVIPEDTDQSLRALGDAIKDYGITTLWLTAGLFHAMVDERPDDLASIKQLLTGGDVVSPIHAAKLLKAHPSIKLINGYGPTENTTFTCCHEITIEDLNPGKSIPIGKPITGTDVFILDEHLEKVVTGEEGELCASGKGLALGYWRNPKLTAEKFVKAPWDPTITLYRTGDKVKKRSDGTIEFIGRVDTQVKIRGFRVELGEIENALGSFPGILQCAVIAEATNDQANKVLKAYFSTDLKNVENKKLREHLSGILPSYAIPNLYYQLEKLPLTPNGKIDRNSLVQAAKNKPESISSKSTPEDVAGLLTRLFEEVLETDEIERSANFFDLGASSLHIARVHEKLQAAMSKVFSITYFFEYSTIDELSQFLEKQRSTIEKVEFAKKDKLGADDDYIAIIGMAGKFPGAPDVETFWQNLLAGKETISHFTSEELDFENGRSSSADGADLFVKARGIVEGTDLFDAQHFGIPPKEAEQMDPQHRLLLECAQTALEDAGYDPDRFDGKIGIYSGSSQNSYLLYNLCSDRSFAQQLAAGYPVNNFPVMFGNDKDFLPSRIAYKLNLKGPAVAVQCACSTSLVAVAQAAESLLSGQSDMVLAGGISLTFPQKRDYLYTPDGMASSDGHCRTFDAEATGTVFGEGAGIVVLRRLQDAIESGDDIIAVIRGYSINNDGSAKAGYAAPSVKGQVDVIINAQKAAGVTADSIGYIEAHGTGTPLGDPIEVAALTEAFSRSTSAKQFCALGTAKTNVGHLDIAAGVTGLIKTALTIKNGEIPPLLHYNTHNKNIDFKNSAFYPARERQKWKSDTNPRRAGVSAFGVGGTNIHMILEEAPETTKPAEQLLRSSVTILPVSASSPEAVKESILNLGTFVSENNDLDIDDIAENLKYNRRQYLNRTVLTVDGAEDFVTQCATFSSKIASAKKYSKIAFMFPGQGSQHIGMGKQLFEAEDVFRSALTECAELLEPHLNENLLDIIYPDEASTIEMAEKLRNTRYAQPAIFSIGYALAKQWSSWNIEPECFVGHSIGEFAAACLAGVFNLEDGIKIIALRGQLMADLPEGAMISVRASEKELIPFLNEGMDLAAINGSKACVLSGPFEAANKVEIKLEEAGFPIKRLHTSHAFHSAMMDPIVETFAKEVKKLSLSAPEIPILSTVTAKWLSDGQACDPDYWASHLRQTVRFYDTIRNFWEAPEHILVEVGPGQTLTALASQNPKRRLAQPVIASLPSPTDSVSSNVFMHGAFGNLWCNGYKVDWSRVSPKRAQKRIKLPSYPFQRKRFWVEPKIVDSKHNEEGGLGEDKQSNAIDVGSASEAGTEATLKVLLSELSGLELEELDSSASFLELGFDSLLLTQVGKEIRDTFGVTVTLRELIDGFASLEDLISFLDTNASPEKISPMTGKDMDISTIPVVEGVKILEKSSSSYSLSAPIENADLTTDQAAHINELVTRYTRKTAESKRQTAKHRAYYADPRTASGFNRLWKEMVYQIITVKSKGSRLLDIDGNEYIDLLNGFGPGFLGHSPDIIIDAVSEQLKKGFEVGPQSLDAMEASKLFCEVTGNERTSFVSTGSEAVQAVIRIARTITGRDKIVMFARDYHGNFDEVLVRGVNNHGQLKSIPMAPGIPKKAAADMIVLPYGLPQSLEIIREIANELAAVIVEPVQSRRPDFQPRQFIRDLRKITEKSNSLFIFDEVVTGFRFGLRGAQEFYGIDADLITYGKVIGGGMPIGVVSGKAKYMDTFDGGQWQYGDASFPDKPVTFFAGTFVRHPLAMASVKAMLNFLKDQPPFFWKVLDAKGDRLATTVDNYFKQHELPFSMTNCGSLMYVKIEEGNTNGSLLFAHMREKGVFLLEEFPCYLTAAHSEEDIDYVINAFKESADELMAAGFFGKRPASVVINQSLLTGPTPLLGENSSSPQFRINEQTTIKIPTTESQKEILLATRINPEASTAYNESVSLILSGSLNIAALTEAINLTINRHDALRSRFASDGMTMTIGPDLKIGVPVFDIKTIDENEKKAQIDRVLREEVDTPLDLENGPYIRARIIAVNPSKHILVITAHHIICDGWSIDVVMHDIGEFYTAIINNLPASLPPAESIISYARIERYWQTTEDYKKAEDFWMAQFRDSLPSLNFPTDNPHPKLKTTNGARLDTSIDPSLVKKLRRIAAKENCTFVNILFSAFNVYISKQANQQDMVIGIPTAGQSAREMENLVGHCVNLLPIRSKIDSEMSFIDYMKALQSSMLKAFDNKLYTYGTLIKNLKITRDPSRVFLTPIVFNFDNGIDLSSMKFGELATQFVSNPRTHEHFEIFVNLTENKDNVAIEWSYNTDLFKVETMERHIEGFNDLLLKISEDASFNLGTYAHFLEDDVASKLVNSTENIAPDVEQEFEDNASLKLVEKNLETMWLRVLKVDAVSKDDDFFELGGHSLLALRLFAQIQKKYNIDLPISTLFLNPTIEKLAVKICQTLDDRDSLVRTAEYSEVETPTDFSAKSVDSDDINDYWCTTTIIKEEGSKPPIFIVGGLGGNVNNLRDLAVELGDQYPVIGIQTRGILGHTPHTSIEDMAREHIRDIRAHQKSGPYYIAGYSGGGLTAFEIVRQLEKQGEKIGFLGILDTFSPNFTPVYEYGLKEYLKHEAKILKELGLTGFWRRASAKLRNSTLGEVYVRASSNFFPIRHRIRLMELAWLEAANKYNGGKISSEINLYRSAPVTLADEKIFEFDKSFGWKNFSRRQVNIISLEGDHLSILKDENAAILAAYIKKKIGDTD
jgi:amino acid adenylation domain-containing protein